RLQAAPERQAITLSTTPAVAVRWLLPWVCILRDAHPLLDLRIHATHEPVALDGSTADLAIRYGKGQWPGLIAEKLFENIFVPACSPTLTLHQPEDLPNHNLIHSAPHRDKRVPVDWANWQKHARLPGLDPHAGLTFS